MVSADDVPSATSENIAPSCVGQSRDAYLLWVRGMRGPYPQVVFSDAGEPPTIGRSAQSALLSIQKLHPALDDCSLDQLAAAFPLRK